MDVRFLGNINNKDFGTSYAGAIWDKNFLCPTLNTMQGGGRQPMIIEAKKIGIIACFALDGSENFGLKPNGGRHCKTLKASTHDIGILERVWKSEE